MSLIRKVAVLGSGVMGSGIAAHVANAGIPVLMLDMVPPEAKPGEDTSKKSFRNNFALGGLVNLKKLRPAPSTSRPLWISSRSATSTTTCSASRSATGSWRW